MVTMADPGTDRYSMAELMVIEMARNLADCDGKVGVVRTKRLLEKGERALIERLRLRVAILALVEQREAAQGIGDIDMVRAESLLEDGERALVQRLCLGVAALIPIERGKAAEC